MSGAIMNPLSQTPVPPQSISLTNSIKKPINSQSSHSETKTRSFSDVLNAMRDTDVIEEEKRRQHVEGDRQTDKDTLLPVYEHQSEKDVNDESNQEINNNQAVNEGDNNAVTSSSGNAEPDLLHKRNPSLSNNEIGFITDDENRRASYPSHSKSSLAPMSKFILARKSASANPGSVVEVYSDSLNTKSEEKKYASNSHEEEQYRSSPSFYKIDTEENEIEIERDDTSKDVGEEGRHNHFIPASSFASGAQAQIAYTDQFNDQM